jgi:hypothetical protein
MPVADATPSMMAILICSAYSRSKPGTDRVNVLAQVSASVMMPALAPRTLAQML